MVLTQFDIFNFLDQKKGRLNFFIFRQMPMMNDVNDPLFPLSSIKLFFTFTLVLYPE